MKAPRLALLAVIPFVIGAQPVEPGPKFHRALALEPNEGVFAYSRISPDGRYLAYASEMRTERRGVTQMINIVDLKTGKVQFEEAGIDAFFSNDGKRVIFLSFAAGGVTIRNQLTGALTRNAAPAGLGDYFSWATRDGRELILTINSNYYYLDGDKAVLPHGRVPSCPGIGTGERPLISRDGRRISTFVRGTVVIRNLTDCDYTFDTGINGAKTDFSWDGRYVAMHAPRAGGASYDIVVVDLQQRTVRNVTSGLSGSSYYPSWTRDGRLSFRYDGADYKGFMFASDVLRAPATPMPAKAAKVPAQRAWADMFPETSPVAHAFNLVVVYGTWSAHSPIALADLQKTRAYIDDARLDVGIMTATAPGSREADVRRMLDLYDIDLPRIPLAPARAALTEVTNQSPATLLFRDGQLLDRRLGAQTAEELAAWLAANGAAPQR